MQIRLTTIGARSGEPRTATLYAWDAGDGALVIVGSAGGRAQHPSWVHNLRAHPEAVVAVRREERTVLAREVDGPERERLWTLVCDAFPMYARFQARTERVIPLFLLEAA